MLSIRPWSAAFWQYNFDQGQDKRTLEILAKSCCHWGAASVGLGGSSGGADLGVPALDILKRKDAYFFVKMVSDCISLAHYSPDGSAGTEERHAFLQGKS